LHSLKLVSLVTDVRASEEDEDVGLDMSEHNEQGYSL
jgi:ammonia channel protein AmtB